MSETALTVNGNLVACGIGGLQGCGVTDSAGAHNEEGGLCLVLSQDVVQARRVGRRTIYEMCSRIEICQVIRPRFFFCMVSLGSNVRMLKAGFSLFNNAQNKVKRTIIG